jgi:hypothetical protein
LCEVRGPYSAGPALATTAASCRSAREKFIGAIVLFIPVTVWALAQAPLARIGWVQTAMPIVTWMRGPGVQQSEINDLTISDQT